MAKIVAFCKIFFALVVFMIFSAPLAQEINTLVSWGYNSNGQLGNGTNSNSLTPNKVTGLTNLNSIASGYYHTLALKSDKSVWGWGRNDYGQLGIGNNMDSNIPIHLLSLANVDAISAGYYHSLALKEDGSIWAWGYNYSGQLGDGSNTDSSTPVQVSNLSNVIAVAGCGNHSLALKDDGSVWAWGYNFFGQLGNGSNTDSNIPVQVSSLSNVIAIAGGGEHSLALKNDGSVWAWGYNYYGQLGNGSNTDSNIPVQVSGLSNVIAIAGGEFHSLALKQDGTVWAWGRNDYGQLGVGNNTNKNLPVRVLNLSNVVRIAGGGYHSLALLSDGTVWAWGYNYYGELGNGTTTNKNFPVQVFDLTNVFSVDGGGYHSIAIINCPPPDHLPIIADITDKNECFQTGITINFNPGSPATRHDLYKDASLLATNVTSPINYFPGDSDSHIYMIRAVNGFCTLGDSNEYYFSDGGEVCSNPAITSIVDKNLTALSGVIINYVSASPPAIRYDLYIDGNLAEQNFSSGDLFEPGDTNFHCYTIRAYYEQPCQSYLESLRVCAKDRDAKLGVITASGLNDYGQLGCGWQPVSSSVPLQVLNITNPLISISAGYKHSLTVKGDGTVWAWGSNNYGQLGNNSLDDSATPVQVVNLTGAAMVSGGYLHSLALKNDGTVWAWGDNFYYQLGRNCGQYSLIPVQTVNLTNVISISAGEDHSLALRQDRTVWAWGKNTSGQLGNGTNTNSYIPVQAQNLTDVVAISAGGDDSLAIKTDGSLWAWGKTINSSIPCKIMEDVVAVCAGQDFSLALKNDGTVWAWGDNTYGQLGTGNNNYSSTPVQVVGISNIVKIGCGYYHSLALRADGVLFAWGRNDYGQLGIGNQLNSNIPVQVSSIENVAMIDGGGYHSLALVEFRKPVISEISDLDVCSQSGLQITFSEGSPSTRNDLYVDGILAQSGVTSPILYNPNDTLQHNYKIRTVVGIGDLFIDSDVVSFLDDNSCPLPGEVGAGTNFNFIGQTISWNSDPYASSYRVYRGTYSQLENLCDSNEDFCIRYDGALTTLDISNDAPEVIDPLNRVVFYLITAYNSGGEGSAGNATCGQRIINAYTNCQ